MIPLYTNMFFVIKVKCLFDINLIPLLVLCVNVLFLLTCSTVPDPSLPTVYGNEGRTPY